MGESMIRYLLTLALLLPISLVACGSGTGDIPGPGCQSVAEGDLISFAETPAGDAFALQCLASAPIPDAKGAATCGVFFARASSAGCDCAAADGLKVVPADLKVGVANLFGSLAPGCVCEVQQLAGKDLQACVQEPGSPHDAAGVELSGFCYADGAAPLTSPELLKDCAATEKRALRILGRPAIRQQGDVGIAYFCVTDACAPLAL
jgi:hypothetical protein